MTQIPSELLKTTYMEVHRQLYGQRYQFPSQAATRTQVNLFNRPVSNTHGPMMRWLPGVVEGDSKMAKTLQSWLDEHITAVISQGGAVDISFRVASV